MRQPPKKIQVPFLQDGNMSEDYHSWNSNLILKDNYEFEDELIFDRLIPRRAGTKFFFRSCKNGLEYYMFPTEAEQSIPLMDFGRLVGKFTFVKRSKSFGIKLVT